MFYDILTEYEDLQVKIYRKTPMPESFFDKRLLPRKHLY